MTDSFPLTVGTSDTEDALASPRERSGELSEREEEREVSGRGGWRRLDPFKCSAALQVQRICCKAWIQKWIRL